MVDKKVDGQRAISQASDEGFMREALFEAQRAFEANEVPVGAVLVSQEEVVGRGFNCPISSNDPTAHAEIAAIRQLASHRNNYRIPGVTLYVTIEPCMMCVGAIIHARIDRVVFGALEPKAGALLSHPYNRDKACWNHQFDIQGGVLEASCGELMSRFFKLRRTGKSKKKK